MVPLIVVSVVAPEHAEARPLLPELDGVALPLPLPLPLPLALPLAGKEEGSNDTGADDEGLAEPDPEPAAPNSVSVATKPSACTESSAENWMRSEGPVDTIGCGIDTPENVPRSVLPSYTSTLS